MSVYAQAGVELPVTFYNLPDGLVGTVGVRVMQGETVITPRTTDGIVEAPPNSGVYTATITTPGLGTYQVTLDDASGLPSGYASVTLIVTVSGTFELGLAEAGSGPCSLWTNADQVASCCGGPHAGSDLDYAAQVASVILWDLSGRRYGGRCRAVVRPQDRNPGCGIGGWIGSTFPGGCRRLSSIRLAGYPVREVEEVRLDGVVLDPSEYRLFRHRELVRVTEGEVWPSCQYLERDPSEEGTFEVTYTFGSDPPVSGQLAAAKLACEVARACAGQACSLPRNLERVVRQGVQVATNTARDAKAGAFGIPEVDLFLAGLQGPRRRPAVASPDARPYPLVVSVEPAGEGS